MRFIHLVLIGLVVLPARSEAQTPGAAPGATELQDSSASVPQKKKKGGLFGKVKGLAQNKVVQQVAKTAACTMVPGGQVIASAIDGASAKDVATNAVKGAAVGAALGGAGQGSCMSGMAGMGAALGAKPPVAGIPGAGVPGMPMTAAPGMMSAQQMKQMMEQYRKMGIDPAQLAAMQQMMASMAPAGASVPPTAAPVSSAPASPAPAPAPEKGRLLERQIFWNPGTETIQAGSEPLFQLTLRELASIIRPTASRYTIEVWVEDQGSKERSRALAARRAAAVLIGLVREGVAEKQLQTAAGGSDEHPRLVLSESR